MANLSFNNKRLLFPGSGILNYVYQEIPVDNNKLTNWTNSPTNPYNSFTLTDRSTFNIVNTGSISRVFSNTELVKGYGLGDGLWGSSQMNIYITWNSGTADVALQIYSDGSSGGGITYKYYDAENTVEVQHDYSNLIIGIENIYYSVTTTEACDITITGAEWTITNGNP